MSQHILLTDTAGQRHLIDVDGAIITEVAPGRQDPALKGQPGFVKIYLPKSDTMITVRDSMEHITQQIGLEDARRLQAMDKLTKAMLALVEALHPPPT